jgi:hypothetical protein
MCDLTEKNAVSPTIETVKTSPEGRDQKAKPVKRLAWETPKLEDVSEQVMAQPYIRFT